MTSITDRRINKIFAVIIALLLGVQNAYAIDRNDAAYAYLQGDYETAYNIMISLANTSEDKIAQYYLGVMYMKGQGVEQDYETASGWLRRAAEQGLAVAMYKLANLYSEGKGVPKDLEFAYVWYRVGVAHDHKKSVNIIDVARAKLSADELASAQQLLTEYLEKYGPQSQVEAQEAQPPTGN